MMEVREICTLNSRKGGTPLEDFYSRVYITGLSHLLQLELHAVTTDLTNSVTLSVRITCVLDHVCVSLNLYMHLLLLYVRAYSFVPGGIARDSLADVLALP